MSIALDYHQQPRRAIRPATEHTRQRLSEGLGRTVVRVMPRGWPQDQNMICCIDGEDEGRLVRAL